MTTGAGVHRRYQLETCRKTALVIGPGNIYFFGFHWLSQHFKHMAAVFRQLIEKQHTVMRQRNFPGAWPGASANQGNGTGGVMRRTKRTPTPLFGQRETAYRADGGHLQGLDRKSVV